VCVAQHCCCCACVVGVYERGKTEGVCVLLHVVVVVLLVCGCVDVRERVCGCVGACVCDGVREK